MGKPLVNSYKILRADAGVIRDCWLDLDGENSEKKVLVIRQVKFDEGGAPRPGETKMMRLTEEEVRILIGVVGSIQ